MKNSQFKNSFFTKTVAIILVAAFSFYNCDISLAMPDAEIKVPDVMAEASMLSVEDIGIALDAGTVRSKFTGQTGRTIVHIQDAHCNFEAQSNISRILEQLSKDSGIDMISVEGAEGNVDTAWFRAFPDAEIRREVATYFMKKGEITGAEFFSINSDYNGTIFGAETRDYYVQNLRAFLDMYPYKDSIMEYLKGLKSVGERLKSIIYPPKLRELDRSINAFEHKEMDLSKYAEYLEKATIDNKINRRVHGNFSKLIDTLEYEKKIDFDIVDGERTKYIDDLAAILSKENMAELVAQSIRFKKGYIKSVDFYSHLRDLAREHSIPMLQEYPNLFYYYIYSKIYDGIEIEELFKEIDLIERALKTVLIKDDVQLKLDKFSEKVDKLISLVNIELTNDDYDRFSQMAGAFSIDDVVAFYGSMASRYNLNYSIGSVPDVVRENLPKMVDFYEIAIKRDMALVENTLAQMEREGKDRSVLIAGGFHTRGMVDLLERKGVSYVVVTPKITKDVESPYIQVLTNQRTSIEDIITESAMPGTRPEASRGTGGLLSPLLRFGYGISLYLNPAQRKQLAELSEIMGNVPGGMSYENSVVNTFEEAVTLLARKWLDTVKENMVKQLGMTEDQAENEFLKFVNDENMWKMLQSVYLKKYDDYFKSVGKTASPDVQKRIIDAFDEFRNDYSGKAADTTKESHGAEGFILTLNEHARRNSILERKFVERTKQDKEELEIPMDDIRTDFKIQLHRGLIDEMRKAGFSEEKARIIDPSRGGIAFGHRFLQLNMDKDVYDHLMSLPNGKMLVESLVKHELAHIDISNKTDENNPNSTYSKWVKDGSWTGKRQEDFVNRLPGCDATKAVRAMNEFLEVRKESERQEILENLNSHAKDMSTAASRNIGPDLVIVTSSLNEQAQFWQDRLTASDGIRGNGQVVGENSIVVSISEKNWDKGAGNALGTLNAAVRAAVKLKNMADDMSEVKASDLGLMLFRNLPKMPVPDEFEKLSKEARESLVAQYWSVMKEYTEGKSVFTYHTAGKGTRTAPMPGAEANSKPNIKLPRMVEVNGETLPVTILESVIMQTSIYASTRQNRWSVFWGDQVIVNENSVNIVPRHHVEIQGQMVTIDPSISSYGVLLPSNDFGRNGEIMQREKLSEEEVRTKAGGNKAYKSIGSFSVTLDFMDALMNFEREALAAQKGSLNTDPDWWQPMTSTKEEYVAMMDKKGISSEKAAVRWDKMDKFWRDFTGTEGYKASTVKGKVGLLDVGENSLWWDYGQNKFYLENMRLLTQDSPESAIARTFFGVDEQKWQEMSKYVDETSDTGRASVSRSIVLGSTIENGTVENSIVINSTLRNVNIKNAIVIGSTIFDLSAFNEETSLVYNVVENALSVRSGQVVAGVYTKEDGEYRTIMMRTDVSRDGQTDWNNEVFAYDNPSTYGDIARVNETTNITVGRVEEMKAAAVKDLMDSGRVRNMSPSAITQNVFERRNAKAKELEEKAKKLETDAAGQTDENKKKDLLKQAMVIKGQVKNAKVDDMAQARRIVALRMIEFGDAEEFTLESYARTFAISLDQVRQEFPMANAVIIAQGIFAEQARKAKSDRNTMKTALSNLEEWITKPQFREYGPALIKLVELAETDSGAAKELYDSFWRTIPFGTGGRRWKIGIGPNRMNAYMAAITAQGHVEYLKQQYPELVARGDAMASAWDIRAFHKYFAETESLRKYREIMEENTPAIKGISSEDLSKVAALVYAGNGIKYIHATQLRSTPWLSFLVNSFNRIPVDRLSPETREKLEKVQNIMAGIVLSSSHNPYDNNGTKFYENSGAQAPPQIVQQLMDLGNSVQNINYYGGDIVYDEGREKAFENAVNAEDSNIVVLNEHDMDVIDDIFVESTIEEVRSVMPRTFDRLVREKAFDELLVAFSSINGTGDTVVTKILHKLGFGGETGVLRHPKDVHTWEFPLGYGNVPNPEAEKTFNTLFEISVIRTLNWVFDATKAEKVAPSNMIAIIDEEGSEISVAELEKSHGKSFENGDQLFNFVKDARGKYIRGLVFAGNDSQLSEVEKFNRANNIGLMTDPDADRVGLGILKMDRKEGESRLEWISANDNDESGIVLFRHRLEKLLDLSGETVAGENALIKYIKDTRPDYQTHDATKTKPYQLVVVNTVVSNPLEKKIADTISQQISERTGGLVEIKTVTHHVGFKFTGEVIELINKGEYPAVSVTGAVMEEAGIDLPRAMFIMSSEEGEGSLIGFKGSVDKDSGVTGLALAVIAAEQLAKGRTMHDYLMETYENYGYSKTYLEPMVMTGDYGFNMINKEIMGYLRGTVLPDIKKGTPFQLGRFTFDRGKDHYDLVRNMMVKAGYGEKPEDWPQAIRESINILEFETTLEDGTIIKVVARPSGTEPKHKNLVMVVGAPSLSIDEVNRMNREIMDEIMIESYKASKAEYESSIKEKPGTYRISDLTPGDLRELLKVFPIIVSTEAKLSIYFPLRDWINEQSQTLASLDEAARAVRYNELRAIVEGYLINFKETNGVQFVEEAVMLNLLGQLRSPDVNRESVRMQAHLWFGAEIGENHHRDLVAEADRLGPLQITTEDESPGLYAATASSSPSAEVVAVAEALGQGMPAMIEPYLRPTRWGSESWIGYGEEGGATVSVGGVTAPLKDVIEFAPDVFGSDSYSLMKFLDTSKGLDLSIQAHPELTQGGKDEVWIVTSPGKLVYGFSRSAFEKHGEKTIEKYEEARQEYLKLLAGLIRSAKSSDSIPNDFAGDLLSYVKSGNIQLPGVNIGALEKAQEIFQSFHNYKEVSIGDVIPISHGVLHALGANVFGGDPYYFDGAYTTEGKKLLASGDELRQVNLDIDPSLPELEIISRPGEPKVERFFDFAASGSGFYRVTLKAGESISFDKLESAHTLAVLSGEAKISVNEVQQDVPKVGPGEPMLMVSTASQGYNIVASEDTQVIISFTPVPKREKPVLVPVWASKEPVAINGEEKLPFRGDVEFLDYGTVIDARDEMTIYAGQTATSSPVLEGRAHKLRVKSGEITLATKDGDVKVSAGEEFSVDKDSANLEKDPESLKVDEKTQVYNIETVGSEAAVVEVVYELTERENRAYTTFSTVKKYAESLSEQKPIMVHGPNRMFHSKSEEIGSRRWIENIFRGLTNQDFRLAGYLSSEDFHRRAWSEEYTHVVMATEQDLAKWMKDDKVRAILSQVRIVPIDNDAVKDSDKTWDFSVEAVSWAVITAAMTPEDVFALQQNNYTNPAADIYKFLTKVLKRQVEVQDLYTMLPFEAVNNSINSGKITIDDEFMESVLKDLSKRITNLVNKILFHMPIRPFDPVDKLRQRLKVMWSA
jgi:phosphomannomutase